MKNKTSNTLRSLNQNPFLASRNQEKVKISLNCFINPLKKAVKDFIDSLEGLPLHSRLILNKIFYRAIKQGRFTISQSYLAKTITEQMGLFRNDEAARVVVNRIIGDLAKANYIFKIDQGYQPGKKNIKKPCMYDIHTQFVHWLKVIHTNSNNPVAIIQRLQKAVFAVGRVYDKKVTDVLYSTKSLLCINNSERIKEKVCKNKPQIIEINDSWQNFGKEVDDLLKSSVSTQKLSPVPRPPFKKFIEKEKYLEMREFRMRFCGIKRKMKWIKDNGLAPKPYFSDFYCKACEAAYDIVKNNLWELNRYPGYMVEAAKQVAKYYKIDI